MMNDDFDNIFDVKIAQPEPSGGDLLVAAPSIGDGCFSHSVVFIIEHSANGGTMGLVANHPSGYMLHQVVTSINCREQIPVMVGGPVHDDRLYYLHTLGRLITGSVEVTGGIYVGGDFDEVKSYIAQGLPVEGCFRFFIGYSGWTKGQLRSELDRNDWVVSHLRDPRAIMHWQGDQAWRTQVQNLGENYRLWLNFPHDFLQN